MIDINDKSQCCGCWACYNACPKHCIEMIEDEEGFRYPHVDKDKCIDCGLCEKVCPLQKPKMDDTLPESFVVQQKDTEVLRTSTSGGFFTAISKWAIEQGGVVFGAAFGEDMELRHSYAETLDGCKKFRGSKYVQSLIGDCYSQAKNFLAQGRVVVFSGTPCQISGLYHFLRGRKYDNLVTVDLVCRGTPSPLLLRKYLAYHSSLADSKVVDYRSRDKYYGYNYSTASIWFSDKSKEYHKGMEIDMMLRLYFKNICSRPSCYQCHFKTINRVSDITIFDCWDAPSVSSDFSSKGATNVFIHTKRGQEIFEIIKGDFIYHKSQIDEIIKRDGVMIKNLVPENPLRKEFFRDLNSKSLKDVEDIYLDTSLKRQIIARIKPFLYSIGIFSFYMKLKRKLIPAK